MSNQVTIAPVIVNVTGTKKVERQNSVVAIAGSTALQLCVNLKGQAGIAIRENAARAGYVDAAMKAAWPTCDYRPIAEAIAIKTGQPCVISNRASFESLPDRYQSEVMAIESGKNGGMVTGADGVSKPGAKLAAAMELYNMCVAIKTNAALITAKRKAELEGAKGDAAKIEAPKGDVSDATPKGE